MFKFEESTMKQRMSIVLVIFLFLTGCVKGAVRADDPRECAKNFTKDGFKNYHTKVTLKNVNQKVAVDKLVRALGREGFSVTKNDTSKGFVSATFDASENSGLQFTAFIDKSGNNSTAELNYKATGAGLSILFVDETAYKSDLCEFAEAMQSK